MKTYWFKRRRYGYGWTPVVWQGWATVGAFLLFAVGMAFAPLLWPTLSDLQFLALYLIAMLAGLATLLRLGTVHGPKPRWRWGASETDNPDEDY